MTMRCAVVVSASYWRGSRYQVVAHMPFVFEEARYVAQHTACTFRLSHAIYFYQDKYFVVGNDSNKWDFSFVLHKRQTGFLYL